MYTRYRNILFVDRKNKRHAKTWRSLKNSKINTIAIIRSDTCYRIAREKVTKKHIQKVTHYRHYILVKHKIIVTYNDKKKKQSKLKNV